MTLLSGEGDILSRLVNARCMEPLALCCTRRVAAVLTTLLDGRAFAELHGRGLLHELVTVGVRLPGWRLGSFRQLGRSGPGRFCLILVKARALGRHGASGSPAHERPMKRDDVDSVTTIHHRVVISGRTSCFASLVTSVAS